MTKRNPNRGMTLIEVLITFIIFAVLSLISVTVFFSLTKTQTKSNISNEVYSEAQNLLKTMGNSIKQARSIKDTDYCTTSDQLALRMNDDQVYVFTTNLEDQLVLKYGCPIPDPEKQTMVLSGNLIKIEDLEFRVNEGASLKPPSVTIAITVASISNDSDKPQLRASTNLETTIVLRSY